MINKRKLLKTEEPSQEGQRKRRKKNKIKTDFEGNPDENTRFSNDHYVRRLV